MNYPITTETEKLFGTGNNYEERRGELPNYFECVCPEDYGQPITGNDKVQAEGIGDTKERISKT